MTQQAALSQEETPRRITSEWLAKQSAERRAAFIKGLSPDERLKLIYHWPFWAREEQLPPDRLPDGTSWATWLLLAGRGFGKSRTGAEWVRREVESGRRGRLALVARTAGDVRDVVVEGEAGILAISPPWFRPVWEPSKRRLTWPNGAIATTFSADEPDALRGPAHDGAWCDEVAAWRYADAYDMLQMGLRLGDDPRAVLTTTPRPTPLVKMILGDSTTLVTRGSTYANRGNLAPKYFKSVISKYEGTRLGRQELNAELLDDNPLALWHRDQLDKLRVKPAKLPELFRIVVAVDPSISDGKDDKEAAALDELAECGIVVVGIANVGADQHAFVLEDGSLTGSPAEWGRAAVALYHKWKADRLVAETNQGGAMVEHVIRSIDRRVSYKGVHASKGKRTRAEPVSALYEQRKVYHVGAFAELEDQMCEWIPGQKSPDRMDALVWAITELLLVGKDRRLHSFE